MNLEILERYLYQIQRYLPKKEKKDTINELRSLIYEELKQCDTSINDDENLLIIIKRFGSPREVSLRYIDDKRYISIELKPIMLMIMKIVSISLPSALIFSRLLTYFSNHTNYNTLDILLDTFYFLPDVITALLSALAIIFIIFYLLSKYTNPRFKFQELEFDPSHLPKVPQDIFKVKIIEEMIVIIGSIITLYIINLHEGLIIINVNGTNNPILNKNFNQILPYLNINIIITLCLSVYHLAKNHKNLISNIVTLFTSIFGGIILILLATQDIFNVEALQNIGLDFLIPVVTIVLFVGAIGSIIGGIVTFVKVVLAYNK